MNGWLAAAPGVLLAAAVLFGPGLAIGAAAALRGFALVALAPALTFGAVGLLALAFGIVGQPWRPPTAALAVAAVASLIWAVRRIGRPPARAAQATGPRWVLLGGLAVAAVVLAALIGRAFGEPDAISQTNDAVFHLNAVRWAVDTGDASSLLINGVQGSRGFYPAAWHGVVSLIVQLGIGLPVAVNAFGIVLSALAWPLGVAGLLLATTGSRITAGVAAVMSACFATFPLLLLQWGVLYPLHASLALLPAALVAVAGFAPRGAPDAAGAPPAADRGRATRAWEAACTIGVAGLACAGIALAQPATLLPLALGAWLIAAARGAAAWSRGTRVTRVRTAAGLAAGAVAVAAVWLGIGSQPSDGHWLPWTGELTAAWQALSLSHLGAPARVVLALAVAAGLVGAIRRAELRWLVILWGVFAALYVTAAAISHETVRSVLVGAWYEDPYRLAALTTVASAPLAAVGIEEIARLIVRADSTRRVLATVGTAGAVLAVTLAATPAAFPDVVDRVGTERTDPYVVEAARYLDHDERRLLERLPELVPVDATIIGNPGTGMGFGYALTGLDVQPRTWRPPAPFLDVLGARLPDAADDAEVCAILRSFSADYVIDFGPGRAEPGRWVLPGFTEFADDPGFELVAREGDSELWRITACG